MESGKDFNVIKEMDLLLARNTMCCIFGEDITDKKIKIVKNGVYSDVDAVDAFNTCILDCFSR